MKRKWNLKHKPLIICHKLVVFQNKYVNLKINYDKKYVISKTITYQKQRTNKDDKN